MAVNQFGGSVSQADQRLRERCETWKLAFLDETTGVFPTIDGLLWNYAVFATTIRIVRLNGRRGTEPINQMTFDLLAQGYWSSLLIGIRRLLDRGGLRGEKGVYSLRSVLEDVKACRLKLNRRRYIEILRGGRYDLSAMEAEHMEALVAASGRPMWGNRDLRIAEVGHEDFDILSGIGPAARSHDDVIAEEILTRLTIRMNRLDTICDHVSSHIAHAGNGQSRLGKALDEFDIRNARDALQELKALSDLMGVWFANEAGCRSAL